ncbi:hypothetical protein E2I00_013392 [Balaenoptera physalus]|uniref:Autophagy-related protein 9 n=1 Tax=Balaenoptera physalus TaxID=9770 RepID=A0A643C775_BALPH|nr:hypothetical protein E2I00_013392 [Balaenoptera physalus]
MARGWKYRSRLLKRALRMSAATRSPTRDSSTRQFIFIVTFTTFLLRCVDYSVLFANQPKNRTRPGSLHSKVTLSDAILPSSQCAQRIRSSSLLVFLLILAAAFWLFQLLRSVCKLFSYWDIRVFYREALCMPSQEAFPANLSMQPLGPPQDLSPIVPCPAAATASLLASISRMTQDSSCMSPGGTGGQKLAQLPELASAEMSLHSIYLHQLHRQQQQELWGEASASSLSRPWSSPPQTLSPEEEKPSWSSVIPLGPGLTFALDVV